jgi:hypothetical protein
VLTAEVRVSLLSNSISRAFASKNTSPDVHSGAVAGRGPRTPAARGHALRAPAPPAASALCRTPRRAIGMHSAAPPWECWCPAPGHMPRQYTPAPGPRLWRSRLQSLTARAAGETCGWTRVICRQLRDVRRWTANFRTFLLLHLRTENRKPVSQLCLSHTHRQLPLPRACRSRRAAASGYRAQAGCEGEGGCGSLPPFSDVFCDRHVNGHPCPTRPPPPPSRLVQARLLRARRLRGCCAEDMVGSPSSPATLSAPLVDRPG